MIYVGNWAAGASQASGSGRLDLEPEFLLAEGDLRHEPASSGARLAFRDISNSTNERSFVGALLPAIFPSGNSTPILGLSGRDPLPKLKLAALLSSLAFDWSVRQRMSSTHLNWHVVELLALPNAESLSDRLVAHMARLLLGGVHFVDEWLDLEDLTLRPEPWALSNSERLRTACILNAVVAAVVGLDGEDLRHMLAECDRLRHDALNASPKGLWRVDKDLPPEQRQTVQSLVAFENLESVVAENGGNVGKGIDAFLLQNRGDGWMLPEASRIADFGLGDDERASAWQPVAGHLGSRFCDWQLVERSERLWRECRAHQANLVAR